MDIHFHPHWKITLFNDFYNYLFMARPSETDEAHVLQAAKDNFHNMPSKTEFKLEHMW